MRLEGAKRGGDLLGAGVYALLYAEEVIYIGKATKLVTRIYSHRNVWERFKKGIKLPPNVRPMLFSDFHYWPCQEFALDKLERELIAKYMPKHNRLLKPSVALTGLVVNGVVLGMASSAHPADFVRRV